MKVLSVKSPWGQKIIRNGKDIENRSWYTSYRGPLLIHVSKKPESPESGMIIGIVDLIDCLPPDNIITTGNPWAETGQYHWVLKNPREFTKKITVPGKLYLWDYCLSDLEMVL